jgi:hypothetical protein
LRDTEPEDIDRGWSQCELVYHSEAYLRRVGLDLGAKNVCREGMVPLNYLREVTDEGELKHLYDVFIAKQ